MSEIEFTTEQLREAPFPEFREIMISLCQQKFFGYITGDWVCKPAKKEMTDEEKDLQWEYTWFLFKVVMSMSQTYTDAQLEEMASSGERGVRTRRPCYMRLFNKALGMLKSEYGALELSTQVVRMAVKLLSVSELADFDDEDADEIEAREQHIDGDGYETIQFKDMVNNQWVLGNHLSLMCEMLCPTEKMNDDIPVAVLYWNAQNTLKQSLSVLNVVYDRSRGAFGRHIQFRTAVGAAVKKFRSESRAAAAAAALGSDGDVEIGVKDIPIFRFGKSPSRVGVEKVIGEGPVCPEPDYIQYQDRFVLGDVIKLLTIVQDTWGSVLKPLFGEEGDDSTVETAGEITMTKWVYPF